MQFDATHVSTAESSVSHEYILAFFPAHINGDPYWAQWWATDDDDALIGSMRFSEVHYHFSRRTLNIYHQQSLTSASREVCGDGEQIISVMEAMV